MSDNTCEASWRRQVFQTGGGGGFDLPMRGSPLEILIMLLVLGAVVWLFFRLFSS